MNERKERKRRTQIKFLKLKNVFLEVLSEHIKEPPEVRRIRIQIKYNELIKESPQEKSFINSALLSLGDDIKEYMDGKEKK